MLEGLAECHLTKATGFIVAAEVPTSESGPTGLKFLTKLVRFIAAVSPVET